MASREYRKPCNLVNDALEEVALHGRAGIRADELWDVLSLTDEYLRDAVWMMLSRRRDITFVAAPVLIAAASGGGADDKRARAGSTRIVASRDRRLRALGFVDVQASQSFFDGKALTILEKCAAVKGAGVAAPLLAELMEIDNSQFHFQLNRLIGAGLVAKRRCKLSSREGARKSVKGAATFANIVYLRRFAPAVEDQTRASLALEAATVAVLRRFNLTQCGAAIADIADAIGEEPPFGGKFPFPKKALRGKLCALSQTSNAPAEGGTPISCCLEVYLAREANPTPTRAPSRKRQKKREANAAVALADGAKNAEGDDHDDDDDDDDDDDGEEAEDETKGAKANRRGGGAKKGMVYCVRLSTAKHADPRIGVSPLGNAEGTTVNGTYCTSFDGLEVIHAKAASASWGSQEVIDSAAGVSGSELAGAAPGYLCRQNVGQLGLYHSISAIVAASGLAGLGTEDLRRGLGVDTKPYVRIVSSLLAANEIWESKEQVGRNRSARYFHRSFSRTQVGQHRANLKAALCQTRGESKTTAASVIDECIPTESKPSSKSKSVSRDKNATTQTLEREQKVLNYIQSEQVVEKQLLAQHVSELERQEGSHNGKMCNKTLLRILERLVKEGKVQSLGTVRVPTKQPSERQLWALPSTTMTNHVLSSASTPSFASFQTQLEHLSAKLDVIQSQQKPHTIDLSSGIDGDDNVKAGSEELIARFKLRRTGKMGEHAFEISTSAATSSRARGRKKRRVDGGHIGEDDNEAAHDKAAISGSALSSVQGLTATRLRGQFRFVPGTMAKVQIVHGCMLLALAEQHKSTLAAVGVANEVVIEPSVDNPQMLQDHGALQFDLGLWLAEFPLNMWLRIFGVGSTSADSGIGDGGNDAEVVPASQWDNAGRGRFAADLSAAIADGAGERSICELKSALFDRLLGSGTIGNPHPWAKILRRCLNALEHLGAVYCICDVKNLEEPSSSKSADEATAVSMATTAKKVEDASTALTQRARLVGAVRGIIERGNSYVVRILSPVPLEEPLCVPQGKIGTDASGNGNGGGGNGGSSSGSTEALSFPSSGNVESVRYNLLDTASRDAYWSMIKVAAVSLASVSTESKDDDIMNAAWAPRLKPNIMKRLPEIASVRSWIVESKNDQPQQKCSPMKEGPNSKSRKLRPKRPHGGTRVGKAGAKGNNQKAAVGKGDSLKGGMSTSTSNHTEGQFFYDDADETDSDTEDSLPAKVQKQYRRKAAASSESKKRAAVKVNNDVLNGSGKKSKREGYESDGSGNDSVLEDDDDGNEEEGSAYSEVSEARKKQQRDRSKQSDIPGSSGNGDDIRKSRVFPGAVFLDSRFVEAPSLLLAACRVIQVGLANAARHAELADTRKQGRPTVSATSGGSHHASFVMAARQTLCDVPDADLSEAYQLLLSRKLIDGPQATAAQAAVAAQAVVHAQNMQVLKAQSKKSPDSSSASSAVSISSSNSVVLPLVTLCRTTHHYESMIDLPWNDYLPPNLLEAARKAGELYSATSPESAATEAEMNSENSTPLPHTKDAITDGAVASLLSRASVGHVSLRAAVVSSVVAAQAYKSADVAASRAAAEAGVLRQKKTKSTASKLNHSSSSGSSGSGSSSSGKADASGTAAATGSDAPLDDKYMVLELGQVSAHVDFFGASPTKVSSPRGAGKTRMQEQKLQQVVALPLPWMSLDGQHRLEPLWRRYRRAALSVVLRQPGVALHRLCAASEYLPVVPPRAAVLLFVALSNDGIVHLRSEFEPEMARSRRDESGGSGQGVGLQQPNDLFSDDFITSRPSMPVKRKKIKGRPPKAKLPASFEDILRILETRSPLPEHTDATGVLVGGCNSSSVDGYRKVCVFPAADAIVRLAEVDSWGSAG